MVDSCILVKDKRRTGRVESNLLMITQTAAKKILDKRNPASDMNDHFMSLEK
jgi:hypothetical protein